MSIFNREAALWGSIYLAILLSVLTMMGAVTVLFIMLPVTILYVRQNANRFFIVYAIALAIAIAFAGGAGVAIAAVSVFFLIASGMMGRQYKAGASAGAVITVGTVTLIAETLLVFLGASLFGLNIPQMYKNSLRQFFDLFNTMAANTLDAELIRQTVETMANEIPYYIIVCSFLLVLFTHWLARAVLNRYGMNIKGLPPVQNWMLPKSFVWYYLIALGASLFVAPSAQSVWAVILLNLLPLLNLAFVVQGISFLFYFAAFKRWNRALPIVGIVIALFFSYPISMLGLADVALNIRKRMKNQI
ncbi:MAG TPA: DUF2232 domain-containing protein [Bacilli bacterium]